MTRTTNSVILENQIWADNGDTTSPPFDPDTGWDITYSQAGGNPVQRTLMNYNFNQLTALGYDINRYGGGMIWDSTVLYDIGAVVVGSDNIRYLCQTQNSNNDPTVDLGTNWTPVPVTFATDGSISISIDSATNTVTFSLSGGGLSDYALKDLSNVTIGDFSAKLKDGQYSYKQIDGTQVKINVYEILTDTNITFSSDSLSKQMTFGTSENLSDLKDNYTGSSAPSPSVAGQLWNDTSYKSLYIRNNANTKWVTVGNSDTYDNVVPTGTKNINKIDNSRFYILNTSGTSSPVTLQLPSASSVEDDFRMDFVSYGNSSITILAFSGETFYRDNSLVSSYVLSNQENSVFSIIKFGTDNRFYLVGSTKGVDQDLNGLSQQGYKAILDFMCPVGAKWSTYNNVTPPLSGVLGVSWQLISSGYTSVSASPGSGGIFNGSKSLNSSLGTANVESHALSISEIPSHNHLQAPRVLNGPTETPNSNIFLYGATGYDTSARPSLSVTNDSYSMIAYTSTTGSGSSHTHSLNVKTITEVCYKRIS